MREEEQGWWLRVVQLFELEVSAQTMAQKIGVSYNTGISQVRITSTKECFF